METDQRHSLPFGLERIKVIVIEDDPSIREILADWLQKADGLACVGAFATAESAMSTMLRCKPDVALVDINLPGLSGIDCVRQLKPQLPLTQFVVVTVYEDSVRIFEALAYGATGYVLKRAPRDDLIATVREVHAGRSPMTSNIARKVAQVLQLSAVAGSVNAPLSPLQRDILLLLAQGYTCPEVSDTMAVAVAKVNSVIHEIYEKLHERWRCQSLRGGSKMTLRAE